MSKKTKIIAAAVIVAVIGALLYVFFWKPDPLPPVPLDEAHFPDENFRGYISERYDENNDGFLSYKELGKITSIFYDDLEWAIGQRQGLDPKQTSDKHGQFHIDLKGMEYFYALDNLHVSSLNMEELDVSGNPKLVRLDCSGNRLTKLDLSHNPDLEYLECEQNNLTELDVSHNPKLRGLECYTNNLTELDVSHNPELILLECNHCNLNTLNLGEKPELYRLDCHHNKLTVVDLSGCLKLHDVYYDEGVEALGVPEECDVITPYVETEAP